MNLSLLKEAYTGSWALNPVDECSLSFGEEGNVVHSVEEPLLFIPQHLKANPKRIR